MRTGESVCEISSVHWAALRKCFIYLPILCATWHLLLLKRLDGAEKVLGHI